MLALRKRVAKVPKEPGVYRWLDSEGNVLYVGKAKNLKNRMQTYVQAGIKRSAWTIIMIRQIADFDVTVVRSELEAFILESNLIKALKPKYNIMLKDDKGYVYVRITVQKRYPSVEVVRRMKEDKAKYFGPFLGARDTHATLDMLDGILRFRSCKQSLDALNHPTASNTKILGSPCLDYQIGKCSGLCVEDVSATEYRSRITEVERFFRGHFSSIKEKAEELMKTAARDRKFERAARIRDALRFIDDLEQRQIVSDTTGANADIFGIALLRGKIQVVLLRQRDGKLIEQVGFALKGEPDGASDAMAQFLPQYYANTQDIPDTIIMRSPMQASKLLTEWLFVRCGKVVRIVVPERGKKSKLLEMAERNAEQKVEQQFAAWEAEAQKTEGALLELQQLLGLPAPPKRIEGYDVSHLGGTATVGSMVVFVNGKPKREHYRSFNMQTVKEGAVDDEKSLAETLRRRLKYLTDDLRTMTERLQQEGVTLGKALNVDQKALEGLIQDKDSLSGEAIAYQNFTILRQEKHIIAFARLVENPGKILEIKSVWVHKDHRGRKLGQLLVRSILSRLKKGKVYVIIDPLPALEEYYAEIGFRPVRTAPEVLKEKNQKFHVEHPEHPVGTILVYEISKNRADESFADRPDLLLLDGGKGQLSAAVAVLRELNLMIPVAGLAKREEEIFVPDRRDPLLVSEGSQARFLLQRLRDEAHRFANFKRVTRLGHTMFESKLDQLAGIGPKTRDDLIRKFGSADDAIAAADEELKGILTDTQLKALREKFLR